MASSAALVSVERNPLGKRLNSQTKFLPMNLWNYFEQEARKSKVSVNVKKRILKATGIKYLLCSWVWYSFRHVGISESSIVRARMEYHKKAGFLCQENGIKVVCRSPLNSSNRHGSYRRSRIHVDADSFNRDAIRQKIHSLYNKKEINHCRRFWWVNYERWSLCFCCSIFSQNFGTMVFSPGENIT